MDQVTRVYLAGSTRATQRLKGVQRKLHTRGFVTTSRWLDQDKLDATATCDRDIADLRHAEWIILDVLDSPGERAGREVEWGIAWGIGLHRVLIGPERNVFHCLAHEQYMTWDQFFAAHPERGVGP